LHRLSPTKIAGSARLREEPSAGLLRDLMVALTGLLPTPPNPAQIIGLFCFRPALGFGVMSVSRARRFVGIGVFSLSCLLSGAAAACLPAVPATPASAALEQALAWDRSDRVFVARLVHVGPVEAAPLSPIITPNARRSTEVTLSSEQVLKGERGNSPDVFEVVLTSHCVASDLERGEVGDRFVVYVEPGEAGAPNGFVALSKLVEDRALEALARPGIQSNQSEPEHDH